MTLFSERYRYTKPSDVIIRERITQEVQNSICNCIDELIDDLFEIDEYSSIRTSTFREIECYIFTHYFNKLKSNYEYGYIKEYIQDNQNAWYKKLDVLELFIKLLAEICKESHSYLNSYTKFTNLLNSEFKRLYFGYRIIKSEIIEITSEEEIITIESALNNSKDNIKEHLKNALELYSKRPTADYRNSIKESISAVEAISRNITGENVLNFKKMEEKGGVVPAVLRKAFECLYGYTNDKTTGIRHALMDDTNAPKSEEALFMLVSCSAFINYLNKKIK